MEKDKAEEIRQAREWIKANLIPIKTPNNRAGVHIFKEMFQHDTRIYFTDTEFKAILVEEGFPLNYRENCLCVSMKSPCFEHYRKTGSLW